MRKITNEELGRPTAGEFAAMAKMPVTVVLDNVRSLQNVGAFFRTGDAFAVEHIALCGITAVPPNRDIHKTALGAELTVPWSYYETTEACIDRLHAEGYEVLAVEQVEGGEEILESVNRILSAGIPVMGHLGLTPQSIHKFGTYNVRAKEEAEAEKLVRDAHLLSEAGCFGIVLEKIPAALAARVTGEIPTPTIGIGAGGACDGQVLVIHDMLGINKGFSPRFLRRYADLHELMTGAVQQYIKDVKECDFPSEKEQY